jgi:hypothetical protein
MREDSGEGQRGRDGARTRWRGVLTGASNGVDGGVGKDGGMTRSDTRGRERTAVALSERGTETARSGGGCRRAVPTAPLRRGAGTWQPHRDGALTGGPDAGSND